MKFAIVSDIHANLEALKAVLDEIDRMQVDEIDCLGDVVGYGCDPIACLDLIAERALVKLMGNHEYAVLGKLSTETYSTAAKISAEWTRQQLTDREYTIMCDFKLRHESAAGTLVHASPVEPDRWGYILRAEQATPVFDHFSGQICFHGHSHLPTIFREVPDGPPRHQAGHNFDITDDQRYLVNIGSVGQPRDNDPRACFVTYDTDLGEVRFHRVEYDIAHTQEKMTRAQLPDMLVQRLAVGR